MPVRKEKIAVGEYYHVFNRGNNKQIIARDETDYIRFLFLILYCQSNISFTNKTYSLSSFIKTRRFNISSITIEKIIDSRQIDLVNFCIMPNHFHLLLKEKEAGGISRYLQRIQNAHTKYFNTRHDRDGHLFQGPFKSVRVKNNNQLLHLSAYIHRNPRDIAKWKNSERKYPWSSFGDLVAENRWGELLQPDIVLGQFKNQADYLEFVTTNSAKENLDEIGEIRLD